METASCFSPFDLLPLSLIALILSYLRTEEKLQVAPLVCQAWRHACLTDPLVWQIIDLHDWENTASHVHLYDVLSRLVPRAGSALRKLDLQFIDYEELATVVRRCQGSIERLRVCDCDMTDEWAWEYAPKLHMLKHLELVECYEITRLGVAAFGRSCPALRRLSVIPYSVSHAFDPGTGSNSHPKAVDIFGTSKAVDIQSQELLFIFTILRTFPNLDSLSFYGKYVDFNVEQLSDTTVRARFSKDVHKLYRYVSQARAPSFRPIRIRNNS